MEIDDTFSNLEEIKNRLEEEGFVCRISFDEADEDDDTDLTDVETTDFAAEADPKKIEMWEAELPDDDFEDENDNDFEDGPDDEEAGKKEEAKKAKTDRIMAQNESGPEKTDDAEVVYFDLFKKKVYSKTLIFQREEEAGRMIYKLIGFCEAPMV